MLVKDYNFVWIIILSGEEIIFFSGEDVDRGGC